MKNLVLKVFMAIVVCLFSMQQSWAADTWSYPTKKPDKSLGGGKGDVYEPYLIKTAQQLADFAWLVNNGEGFSGKYVALAADITLNDINFDADNKPTNLDRLIEWTNIGEYGFFSNDYFCGSFDGRGHTISGLYINTKKDDYTGLFGALWGSVSNLNIKDSYMLGDGGNDATGFLVGYMKRSVIDNCHISNSHIDIATNSSCNIGGIAGQGSGDGKAVLSSSFSGTMKIYHSSGTVYVAGIMGLGAPRLESCRVDGQMDLYSANPGSSDEIYANGLCYEGTDITGCVNYLNFTVQNEEGSSKLHTLDLNTLCKSAQNVSQTANLGSVRILSTNGWKGMVGNIFKAKTLHDCAFYGGFNGADVNRSTSGKLTFYYLGEQRNYIQNSDNDVFLCKDGYTFVTGNTERFDYVINNLKPDTYTCNVYAYPENRLNTDDFFSTINRKSPTMYVWGKIKGRGDFLDGCPLPVACGGVLDADLKGEGTEESPWLIGSETELRKLAEDVNKGKVETSGKFFALTADIDMTNSEAFDPIGNSQEKPFRGTFDGQGHAISGIKIKNLGLIGYGSGCKLKRLAVIGAELQGESDYSGVLLGQKPKEYKANSVSDCYVGGDIKISADKFNVAGIVGNGVRTTIKNCYFKGRFIVDTANSAKNSLRGIINDDQMAFVEGSYASFSVVAPDGMSIEISGIGNGYSTSIAKTEDSYSVCSQINRHSDKYDYLLNGKICDNDSEIFADYQFPSDSPWQKGVFRYVLKDAKNYVATAADGTDTEAYYDAIAMADSNNPSNDIYHYTLKAGEESDKLLWALPNLAIYNPADRSEYIINCTLDPAKPFNYNTKTSCKAETVKVNMRYPLALETGKNYYTLCLPGTVQSANLPSGSALYIGGEVKEDGDGNRYINIVRADSVAGGIPFVAYIPNPTTGETIDILMRSRMALEPLKSISGSGHTQNFALRGTYKGGAMSDVCNKLVESDGKMYLTKVAGEQPLSPFTAYLENEEKVELRNYVLLDEMSNDIDKVLGDVNGSTSNVMLERALRSDGWNTICLPFDMTVEEVEDVFGEGTKVEALVQSELNADGVYTFHFASPTYGTMYKGMAYLIKPASNGSHYIIPNRKFDNMLTPISNPVYIDGTYYTISLCGTFARKVLGTEEDGLNEYFIQDNKIMHVANGRQIVMNGFRGYITANEAAANALSKARIVHSDGSTTDLRLVEVGSTADGKQRIYNLQGIEQNSDSQQRGVYIKGSRKYVK